VDEIVVKLTAEGTETGPPPGVKVDAAIRVQARSAGRQRKYAEAWPEVSDGKPRSRWALYCDEGAGMGGDDSAPPPLVYFASAVAF
jgi:hypothetical protein